MTPNELRHALAVARYPETFVVDAETYDAAEAAVVDWLKAQGRPPYPFVGPHFGLWFKGVELLCEGRTAMSELHAEMCRSFEACTR
jgi:hypothetical protein